MNWLKKIAQAPQMPLAQPQPMTQPPPPNLIEILNNIINVRGGDINYAEQKFKEAAPVPEDVCAKVSEIGESPQMAEYRESMRILALAGGCPWPPQSQQQDMTTMPSMPSMGGQQEIPGDMPSVEIE